MSSSFWCYPTYATLHRIITLLYPTRPQIINAQTVSIPNMPKLPLYAKMWTWPCFHPLGNLGHHSKSRNRSRTDNSRNLGWHNITRTTSCRSCVCNDEGWHIRVWRSVIDRAIPAIIRETRIAYRRESSVCPLQTSSQNSTTNTSRPHVGTGISACDSVVAILNDAVAFCIRVTEVVCTDVGVEGVRRIREVDDKRRWRGVARVCAVRTVTAEERGTLVETEVYKCVWRKCQSWMGVTANVSIRTLSRNSREIGEIGNGWNAAFVSRYKRCSIGPVLFCQ